MLENSPLPTPADANSLLEALRDTSQQAGLSKAIVEDITGAKLSYRKFWLRMHLLGSALTPKLSSQTRVGVLLPTSVAAAVTFFSLHHIGRIPVMLNFSAGVAANRSAIKITELDHIITSKAFILKAKLEDLVESLSNHVTIIYLEDIKKDISKLQAIGTVVQLLLGIPKNWAPRINPQDPAVILFTSGSEGTPKGVVLSHKNLLSNIAQVKLHLEFGKQDNMLNVLPVFHSFGLTAGTLLPLILGFPVYFFPSPLQYKQIPPLAKEIGATIFLSTDTFLRGYALQANKEDFSTLKLIVAGAERLKPQTSDLYKEKFGISILQGYGVTETSPVASANTPKDNIEASVGKLLTGMEAKLKPVEGIEEGGALLLKGPNVMLGYMKEDQPGILQPAEEWYDTGDIVRMDEDGRIYITGRLKRFAKIGGEMVSLGVVEEIATEASPEAEHAAVAISDTRKGEQIILLTEDSTLTREALITAGKAKHTAELYIPKKVHHTNQIPRLGNGKINYIESKKVVEPL